MKIIPAIDVRCGEFVVFVPNQEIKEKFKNYTPVEVAQYWVNKGASDIYITDYDGLFKSSPQNLDVLAGIKQNVEAVLYYSAGISTIFDLEKAAETGADYLIFNIANLRRNILSNQSLQNYIDRLIIGIDIMEDFLAIEGFNNPISINLEERLQTVYDQGFRKVLITDITKKGNNDKSYYKQVIAMADKIGFTIIVAGGIQSAPDLFELKKSANKDFEAAIMGRALYTGKIKYQKQIIEQE